jgi:hypothetical protein
MHRFGGLCKHPLVGAIYRAVADVVEGRLPSSSPSSTLPEDRWQYWHRDEVNQLQQEVLNPTILALLDLVAERPGKLVSFDKVYEKAGRTQRQAMGDLAGFTQLIKRRFKRNEEGWWPVDIHPGKSLQYSIPEEIAGYWREARSR